MMLLPRRRIAGRGFDPGRRVFIVLATLVLAGCAHPDPALDDPPFLVVLGIAQDAGIPQAGSFEHPAWRDDRHRRLVSCLGLVDPATGRRWMLDATPDFRRQLHLLHEAGPDQPPPTLAGIFLTHAHIGHYTGLMFLGHESMGARSVPVYAMPRMRSFIESNGPWDQLVRYENIDLRSLRDGESVQLTDGLRVTPFLVPHRQEYSEVVGYRIDGPHRSALFIPDIDSWTDLDAQGTAIEDLIAEVDVAYLDGTFFANGEIPGRDMSGFPHPFITASVERFGSLPDSERRKIRFIHLNHTNPAQFPGSPAERVVEAAGMGIAQMLEREPL